MCNLAFLSTVLICIYIMPGMCVCLPGFRKIQRSRAGDSDLGDHGHRGSRRVRAEAKGDRRKARSEHLRQHHGRRTGGREQGTRFQSTVQYSATLLL